MKTKRRYIYDETYQEVMKWAEEMNKVGMLDKSPNGIANFPFYLQQYLKNLKFKAKKG